MGKEAKVGEGASKRPPLPAMPGDTTTHVAADTPRLIDYEIGLKLKPKRMD